MDEELINYMEQYDDEKYMFAGADDGTIYVLEKTENTILKGPEYIVNEEFATYVADESVIVDCFHIDDYKNTYVGPILMMRYNIICYKRYECIFHILVKPKTGKLYAWHDSGELSIEAEYKDGKSDGVFITRYPDGNIHKRAEHKDGKLDGVFITRYPDGNIHKRTEYKDGKKHGNKTIYFPNGKKSKSLTFKDGVRDGQVIIWDEEGDIAYTEMYKNNIPHGEWTSNIKKENIRVSTTYGSGKKNGKYYIWRNNVLIHECDYVDDVIHGKGIWYDEHGKLLGSCNQRDGELCGKLSIFDEEGAGNFHMHFMGSKDGE